MLCAYKPCPLWQSETFPPHRITNKKVVPGYSSLHRFVPSSHRPHNPRLRPPLHLFRLSRLLSSHPRYRRQQIPRPNQHSARHSPLRQPPPGPLMLSSWPRRSARQPCTTPPPHPRVRRSGLQLLITLNVAVEAVTPALKIGLVNMVASVCNIEASLFGSFRPCIAPMLCAHSKRTATTCSRGVWRLSRSRRALLCSILASSTTDPACRRAMPPLRSPPSQLAQPST